MRDLLRQAVLAIMVGLTMLAGAGVGLADPPGEVEMPGILTAVATCDFGKASVTVWIDDNSNDPIAVRLDRLHPDTATQTRNTELDEDRGLHKVVFEPVTIGDYNVHIDGRDGVADDLTVVVKDCADVKPKDDPLTIEVECKAGWGIATFQVANPDTDKVVRYTLTVDVISEENIELSKGLFLRVTLNALDDGTYTAELTGDVEASKDFVVKCAAGNAPKLDVTTEACGGTSAKVSVAVRNPNRATVDYRVTLKDVTKTLSVPGGQSGTVTFPGLAAGEYPVRVTGADQTESASVATVDCGQPSTTPSSPTTTTTPAPQGRSDSGLANTGASVGGLLGTGGLVLLLGAALVIVGRRRRAHQN